MIWHEMAWPWPNQGLAMAQPSLGHGLGPGLTLVGLASMAWPWPGHGI